MTASGELDLATTFVVMGPDQSATPVAFTATLFEELDAQFDNFRGRMLVASFSFTADWPTWEMHPAGDELVCILDGSATLVLDRGGVEETHHLSHAGAFVIVPKGTWHTARTSVPTRMLFVTPGAGTQNKPI